MNTEHLNGVIDSQIKICKAVLVDKAKQYATEDRLHNFNVAAKMQGCLPRRALAGMMAKHTVSVYDMCMSDEDFSLGMWDEKITDHINYLLLLRAVVLEENRNKTQGKVMCNDGSGETC